ncbi:MAG: AMP-binding protein, partial [Clostridiaceae bacterium]
YIDAYSEVMDIDSSDIFGNQSPLDYIAAIRDIYLPLKHGASTVIIPKELYMTPGVLFDFMNENKITSVGWSVSALTLPVSLGAFDHTVPKYLKKVCFSGSVMPCRSLRIWQDKLPNTKFVNQYGPTEATASCTYYVVENPVSEEDILPIGSPYKDYRVFLLSEENTETPTGEIGEICVSGPILALGYYNNHELTRKSFIQNPLNNKYDERIYKTGDLGLMRSDGILEFHGRKDRQIKHLGHRVELGEIEQAAGNIPGIEDCCTVYNKETDNIFLFYTGASDKRNLAVGLREVLPGFMVPRKLIKLEAMPRLSNGKIDMQSLREYINNK